MQTNKNNAAALENEIEWFNKVLNTRMQIYFGQKSDVKDIFEIEPPGLKNDESAYGNFTAHYRLSTAERIVFMLALIANIKPQLLDIFLVENKNTGNSFTEFGGRKDSESGRFIPTYETAIFILAGDDLEKRFSYYHLFDPEHYFTKHNIFSSKNSSRNEYHFNTILSLSSEIIDLITTGRVRKPTFGAGFPAKLIETELEWNDLVLESYTLEQIQEIKTWIEYGHVMLNGMGLSKKIKPGFRSLFYGPPGTGKTFTASLLGKVTGLDVYRIDLSMVVSKYIGETEKNLENIFQQAEYKNWILFFDEADALFGKRTSISDAHDRFANQEVSYLLQRVEDYPGVVILASNMRTNLDEAFTRRFQSIIYFPVPKTNERLKIWSNAFSEKSKLDDKINLAEIAAKYELTGGSIMNVVRCATLMSLKKGTDIIFADDLIEGIRKEFQKEGKKF
ncbi:MAG: ATP-binding protein [Ignavibacteriales bacterium]|nr:ATP-binding protein [Ignavibacteriales bacterium]